MAIASLILVLLVVGLVLAGLLIVAIARMLLRPPRMSDGKALYLLGRLTPDDLGLAFEPYRFIVRDPPTGRELAIAAWWIPHPAARGRCVILIHGYADAKVGAIAWAPLLHEAGFNILAVDLRAHGESGGRYCTAGYYERHDLDQVINQLRAERPQQARQVVLFGISLGAAAALGVAGLRDDLAGAILESPYVDFRSAVRAHARHLAMPAGWLLSAGLRLAEWISQADFGAVRPVDLIGRARCPLMIITCTGDTLLGGDERAALCAAAKTAEPGEQTEAAAPAAGGPTGATPQGRQQAGATTEPGGPTGATPQGRQQAGATAEPAVVLWEVEGIGHLAALATDSREYARRVGEFLKRVAPGM